MAIQTRIVNNIFTEIYFGGVIPTAHARVTDEIFAAAAEKQITIAST